MQSLDFLEETTRHFLDQVAELLPKLALALGIVLVGFFYVWKKGVLDWGPTDVRSGVGSGVRRGGR